MNVTAIVLAAGESKRFGKANKLFALYHGAPLIDHCLKPVLEAEFNDRIIVTGFEHDRIEAHIKRLPARTVCNPDFEDGLGTSLAAGVKALNPACDAFLVFLADMPDIPPTLISELMGAYDNNSANKSIVRPVYKGSPGHPVLFATSHAPEMRTLAGDQGAFEIIKKHKTSTLNVEVKSSAVVQDVDKLSDLKK